MRVTRVPPLPVETVEIEEEAVAGQEVEEAVADEVDGALGDDPLLEGVVVEAATAAVLFVEVVAEEHQGLAEGTLDGARRDGAVAPVDQGGVGIQRAEIPKRNHHLSNLALEELDGLGVARQDFRRRVVDSDGELITSRAAVVIGDADFHSEEAIIEVGVSSADGADTVRLGGRDVDDGTVPPIDGGGVGVGGARIAECRLDGGTAAFEESLIQPSVEARRQISYRNGGRRRIDLAGIVGDPHRDAESAVVGEGTAGGDAGGVVEGAVAVEVPVVGDDGAVAIDGGRGVEGNRRAFVAGVGAAGVGEHGQDLALVSLAVLFSGLGSGPFTPSSVTLAVLVIALTPRGMAGSTCRVRLRTAAVHQPAT